jgi:DNA invertase Pin-like site-specific DNA recombinase
MTHGYTRISTLDQSASLQADALLNAGCDHLYNDTASGSKESRPQLDRMLDRLRPGDTVIVWRLDRLGRSLKHLIELVEKFKANGVAFRSLTENIDTSTPGGILFFQLFGAFAEYERNLIRERTNAGLAAAKLRGRKGGRPAGLTKKTDQTARIAESLNKENKLSVSEICEQLTISKATYYRYLKARAEAQTEK